MNGSPWHARVWLVPRDDFFKESSVISHLSTERVCRNCLSCYHTRAGQFTLDMQLGLGAKGSASIPSEMLS